MDAVKQKYRAELLTNLMVLLQGAVVEVTLIGVEYTVSVRPHSEESQPKDFRSSRLEHALESAIRRYTTCYDK